MVFVIIDFCNHIRVHKLMIVNLLVSQTAFRVSWKLYSLVSSVDVFRLTRKLRGRVTMELLHCLGVFVIRSRVKTGILVHKLFSYKNLTCLEVSSSNYITSHHIIHYYY